MNTDELQVVTDFALKIREQGDGLYQVLLAVFVGSILAAAFVASKNNNSKRKLPIVLSALALLFFAVFIFALRAKHIARREFCDKWLANNLSAIENNVKDGYSAEVLVKKFSNNYYSFVTQDRGKSGNNYYGYDSNDVPNILLGEFTQSTCGMMCCINIPAIISGVLFIIIAFSET